MERINPQIGLIAFTLTTLFGLYPIARKSLRLIRTGTPFAIETLMTVAAIGAIFIQATEEAAMVILLFMLGEMLESYSAGRARRGVSALMALVPEEALLIKMVRKPQFQSHSYVQVISLKLHPVVAYQLTRN